MLRQHLYQNISPALQNEKNTANSPLSNSSASVYVTVPDCFSVLDIYLLYYKPWQMRNSLSLQFFEPTKHHHKHLAIVVLMRIPLSE